MRHDKYPVQWVGSDVDGDESGSASFMLDGVSVTFSVANLAEGKRIGFAMQKAFDEGVRYAIARARNDIETVLADIKRKAGV